MANVSLSLAAGGAFNEAVVGSSAPGAGAVELRIANGTSNAEVLRALLQIEAKVRADLVTG